MDYLDLNKQLRHRIILLVGYVLVAIAIAIGAIVLLYQAYGFGVTRNGTVTQNGLTFFSSQPHPASIYANNKLESVATNTRLVLPAGIYHMKLARDGYRDWQRTIELDGGSVEHFDYPFLIPKSLTTKKLQTVTGQPSLVTQSPDHRWLLVDPGGASLANLELYDLKNPTRPAVDISLPADLLTKASASETWQLGEWSDDNQHVLLQHNYDGKVEFVLVDRVAPQQSLNLNKTLSTNPVQLTLKNKKYDQYYAYDASTATLLAGSLKTTFTPLLQHVLAYKSYSDDTLLYATSSDAPAGKALVKLRIGNQTSTIRSLPASATYLLELTKYSDVMYVAVGDNTANRVYIFKDPAGQLARLPDHAVVPAQVLHVPQPNYLSFSNNAQFIVTANGNRFGVYDIENKVGYNYTVPAPLDQPQAHATWMDGDRLMMVSGGKLAIFDYDGTNLQTLTGADSDYVAAFAPDYKTLYAWTPAATAGQSELVQTFLLTPPDR